MIVNIRGVNGSGKSTLVRRFLKGSTVQPLFGCLGPKRPEAYRVLAPFGPLYLLGPYQTPTGGADILSSKGFDVVVELIERYSKRGHVLFEGVMFAVSFGQIGEWLEKHKQDVVVAFIETPIDVCIRSIKDRTGDKAQFARVKEKVAALRRVKNRMVGLGMRVETITRDDGYDKIREWFTDDNKRQRDTRKR